MLVHFVWTWHLVGVDHEAVCRDRLGVGRGCQMLSNTCIPLTIAPKLRICIVQSKQFLDRQGVSSDDLPWPTTRRGERSRTKHSSIPGYFLLCARHTARISAAAAAAAVR